MKKLACVLWAGLGVACGGSSGQTDAPPPVAASAATAAPAGPAGPMTGLGSHHHPIRTSSRDAQTWFDQGVSLVFAFNHDEAVRSFQRAAELDPSAAMPHWGIAWALGPNYNLDIDDPRAKQAFEAVERAKSLVGAGPDAERAYVEALAVRYSADPKADRPGLARRYSEAMRDLVRRYPTIWMPRRCTRRA